MRRPGSVVRTLAVVVYLGGVALGLHLLGVAGYRAGWVWCMTVLVIGGATLAAVALPRALPMRGVWVATAAVTGFILTAPLVQSAPHSKGRLAEMLDNASLSFEVVSEERRGHSWCRPSCPVVERVYRGPNIAPRNAVLSMVTELARAGVVPAAEDLGAAALATRFRIRDDDLTVEVSAERVDEREVHVTVRLSSRRG